jgi:hypothetical protein
LVGTLLYLCGLGVERRQQMLAVGSLSEWGGMRECSSALCGAIHKADYVDRSIMESSNAELS